MDFKVIFKDSFLEDLERMVRSIAAHNPSAAQTFLDPSAYHTTTDERGAFVFPKVPPGLLELETWRDVPGKPEARYGFILTNFPAATGETSHVALTGAKGTTP